VCKGPDRCCCCRCCCRCFLVVASVVALWHGESWASAAFAVAAASLACLGTALSGNAAAAAAGLLLLLLPLLCRRRVPVTTRAASAALPFLLAGAPKKACNLECNTLQPPHCVAFLLEASSGVQIRRSPCTTHCNSSAACWLLSAVPASARRIQPAM